VSGYWSAGGAAFGLGVVLLRFLTATVRELLALRRYRAQYEGLAGLLNSAPPGTRIQYRNSEGAGVRVTVGGVASDTASNSGAQVPERAP